MSRFTRYADILDRRDIENLEISVVGCGALGRQVALALATMGFQKLQLWDPDVIEELNLGTQGWNCEDVGRNKSEVLLDECLAKLGGAAQNIPKPIVTGEEWIRDKHEDDLHPVVFSCVDSMDMRDELFQAWRQLPESRMFIDGRMGAMTGRVLSVPSLTPTQYEDTIIPDEDTNPAPCTARSTYQTALVVSGLMVNQLVLNMTGLGPKDDLIIAMVDTFVESQKELMSNEQRHDDPEEDEGGDS